MDMGKILSVMTSLKNNNLSATPNDPLEQTVKKTPIKKFNCELCYDDPSGADCSNCNGGAQIDLGWGEYVPCGHCEGTGKQLCRCALNKPIYNQSLGEEIVCPDCGHDFSDDVECETCNNSGFIIPPSEFWSQDEMDYPEERTFRESTEKKSSLF